MSGIFELIATCVPVSGGVEWLENRGDYEKPQRSDIELHEQSSPVVRRNCGSWSVHRGGNDRSARDSGSNVFHSICARRQAAVRSGLGQALQGRYRSCLRWRRKPKHKLAWKAYSYLPDRDRLIQTAYLM